MALGAPQGLVPSPVPIYAPGTRLRHGRYHVEGLYAVGGMSQVYLAVEHVGWRHRRLIAIKAAVPRGEDPEAIEEAEERLAHEAILLRLVDYWRVPRVLALFEENDRPHLAMEYVPGTTLERAFADRTGGTAPPWPEARVLSLGRALADLLRHLHAGPTPILLRDLKPANLIVTPQGHLTFVDFGIACPLRPGRPIPASERWYGTRGYAAPEQWCGDGYEDARVDLYALGAILYRAASGHDPARQGQAETPDFRLGGLAVSPRLRHLIGSLLAPDANDRPPQAAYVAIALDDIGHAAAPSWAASTARATS